jgi:abequosyltransferase
MEPLISVCIPAYNRADVLAPLIESVTSQSGTTFEIVICEDFSPQRELIRQIAASYSIQYPHLVRYFENETNLGYDGNLRRLIEKAQGVYCLFLGNDDLMCPGALKTMTLAIERYPNLGAVMRSYAHFEHDPDQISQVFRYFPEERFFPAGPTSITTFFRRMVVLPGIVLHRASSLQFATSRFDGTLLYQLYLVGRILAQMNGVFLPEPIVLYRTGGVPDFGNSIAEKGKFVPTMQTPASSVQFMTGMLRIARAVQEDTGYAVYQPILRDLTNYAYPFIAIQRKNPVPEYIRYCAQLARLGFGRYPVFYAYAFALLILGKRPLEKTIGWIKKSFGYTPVLGRVYRGEKV